MNKRNFFVILLIVLTINFFLSSLIFAEERQISLKECINIALENNPQIIMFAEKKRRAVNNYKIFKGRNGLNVSGSVNMVDKERDGADPNKMKVPGIDTDVSLFAGLSCGYNLYNPSEEEEEKLVRLAIDDLKLDEQQLKDSVISGVINSYYRCYLDKKNVSFAKRRLEQAERTQKIAKIFFEKGSRSILDLTRAEVAFYQRKLDFENSQNAERASIIQLYLSMGIVKDKFEDSDISLAGFFDLPQVKIEIDDLIQLAELHNIELKKIRLKKRKAKININIQKSRNEPSLGLGFNIGGTNEYIYNDNRIKIEELGKGKSWEPSFTAGVRLSLPLYTGGAISAAVDSALSAYNEIEYAEQGALIRLKKDIIYHYKQLEVFGKQMETAELMIKNAERYLLMAQKSYEKGLGTQAQLENAEISLVSSEINLINIKRQYIIFFNYLVNDVGVGEDFLCKK